MAYLYREWRIVAASCFALAVILGAYLLATGAAKPRIAEASTETALLQQIAAKDTDGDGLPDWEEALYGTDPTQPDTFHLGMTDGEAVAKGLIVPKANVPAAPAATSASVPDAVVGGIGAPTPGSLTDTFAKNFFALYVSAEQDAGGTLSSDQIDTLSQEALQMLSSSIAPAPDFESAADIKVAGSGPDALKKYAADAEDVIAAQGANLPKSELEYLQDYLNGDASALGNIAKLAAAYHDIALGLAALSVPQEAAATHLALVNALARVGEAASDFSHADSDPLSAMLALQQYPQGVTDLASAFAGVQQEFAAEDVVLAKGQPGASFVDVISNVEDKEVAPSTP